MLQRRQVTWTGGLVSHFISGAPAQAPKECSDCCQSAVSRLPSANCMAELANCIPAVYVLYLPFFTKGTMPHGPSVIPARRSLAMMLMCLAAHCLTAFA